MVLVDTSIWIDHLRRRSARLSTLLEDGLVACHPFVAGELACGRLARREELLGLLERLPALEPVSQGEALKLLDAHGLPGTGVGWIDVHLLAAARLSGATLWTADRALKTAALALGCSADIQIGRARRP